MFAGGDRRMGKSVEVQGTEISIMTHDDKDFISLTDMLKAKDGDFFISDWLRNRNTVEFWVFGNRYTIPILIMANSP